MGCETERVSRGEGGWGGDVLPEFAGGSVGAETGDVEWTEDASDVFPRTIRAFPKASVQVDEPTSGTHRACRTPG